MESSYIPDSLATKSAPVIDDSELISREYEEYMLNGDKEEELISSEENLDGDEEDLNELLGGTFSNMEDLNMFIEQELPFKTGLALIKNGKTKSNEQQYICNRAKKFKQTTATTASTKTQKLNCPFKMKVKEEGNVFRLIIVNGSHNHELKQRELNRNSILRKRSQEVKDFIQEQYSRGIRPRGILINLNNHFKLDPKNKNVSLLTPQDIYNELTLLKSAIKSNH